MRRQANQSAHAHAGVALSELSRNLVVTLRKLRWDADKLREMADVAREYIPNGTLNQQPMGLHASARRTFLSVTILECQPDPGGERFLEQPQQARPTAFQPQRAAADSRRAHGSPAGTALAEHARVHEADWRAASSMRSLLATPGQLVTRARSLRPKRFVFLIHVDFSNWRNCQGPICLFQNGLAMLDACKDIFRLAGACRGAVRARVSPPRYRG
jgi:hypothetical protein